jgi:hypothetical protein
MNFVDEEPQCFECEKELERIKRQGNEDLGKCPSCSRKMTYYEWIKLNQRNNSLDELADKVQGEIE